MVKNPLRKGHASQRKHKSTLAISTQKGLSGLLTFNLNELRTCIKKVITEPPYYSITVLKSFRKQVANGHKIDEIDRMLLYELSIGTKMNELPNVLPLSMTRIERRKRHLKEIFDLKKGSDRELVILAKEKGFI